MEEVEEQQRLAMAIHGRGLSLVLESPETTADVELLYMEFAITGSI
jgi:hypothetical protein